MSWNARKKKKRGPGGGSARNSAAKSSGSLTSREKRNDRNATNAAAVKSATDIAIGAIEAEPETAIQIVIEIGIVTVTEIAHQAIALTAPIPHVTATRAKRNRPHRRNLRLQLRQRHPQWTRSRWRRRRYNFY